jgi:hypothetical protein
MSVEVAIRGAGSARCRRAGAPRSAWAPGYGAPAARADTYGAAMLYENTGYNYAASPAGSAMLYNDTTT